MTWSTADVGIALPRLERIHRCIVDAKLDVDVDVIRVSDVNRSYPVLRQIDWNSDTSDKHIILDFATNQAIQKVLRQVSAFSMPYMTSALLCHVVLYDSSLRVESKETADCKTFYHASPYAILSYIDRHE